MDWKHEFTGGFDELTNQHLGLIYRERLAEHEREKQSLERGARYLALYVSFYAGLCVGCILSAFAFLVFS